MKNIILTALLVLVIISIALISSDKSNLAPTPQQNSCDIQMKDETCEITTSPPAAPSLTKEGALNAAIIDCEISANRCKKDQEDEEDKNNLKCNAQTNRNKCLFSSQIKTDDSKICDNENNFECTKKTFEDKGERWVCSLKIGNDVTNPKKYYYDINHYSCEGQLTEEPEPQD